MESERRAGVVQGSIVEENVISVMITLGSMVEGRGDESWVIRISTDWSPRAALWWVREMAFSLEAIDLSAREANDVDENESIPSEIASCPLRLLSGRIAVEIHKDSFFIFSSSPFSLSSRSGFLRQLSRMRRFCRPSYFKNVKVKSLQVGYLDSLLCLGFHC